MRKTLTASVTALSVILSGCTAIRSELRHPGGYVGSKLDKHMIDAQDSKRLQVLRAAIIVAMVARAGTVYSRDAGETEAFVKTLKNAADQVNFMAAYLRDAETHALCPIQRSAPPLSGTGSATFGGGNGITATLPEVAGVPDFTLHGAGTVTGVAGKDDPSRGTVTISVNPAAIQGVPAKPCLYVTNFESDVPQLERAIFRLVVQSLPQEAASDFLSSLKTGKFLDAAWDAATTAFAAVDGLRNAAAVNRTSIELQGRIRRNACPALTMDSTVATAAACLGLDGKAMFASTKAGLDLADDQLMDAAFRSVFQNIEHSCNLLPVIVDPSGTEARGGAGAAGVKSNGCTDIEFDPRPRFFEAQKAGAGQAQPAPAAAQPGPAPIATEPARG